MGRQDIVDKTIVAQQTLSSITPSSATGGVAANQLGFLPIGVYKGAAAFFDLDKMANQPLVAAESQYIMGILDGRRANYDSVAATITAAEAIGTVHTATLTVPAGQVWFLNAVEMVLPASGGANIVTGNWACNLWPDLVGSTSAGQAFHAAAVNLGVGGGVQQDEFGVIPILFAITNKPAALRLPGGSVITFTFTNTVAVAAGTVIAYGNLYGYVGKALVG